MNMVIIPKARMEKRSVVALSRMKRLLTAGMSGRYALMKTVHLLRRATDEKRN